MYIESPAKSKIVWYVYGNADKILAAKSKIL
jgi:hypothetical protein